MTGLSLHEIRKENLLNYAGDFELNGSMVIGLVEHKTNIRFRDLDDFESYINAIDVEYDIEDVISTGYIYLKIHLNLMLLTEAFTLKLLIICKKLLNIMDKTVLYQLPESVLATVSIISLIKTIQNNSRISFELRNID